MTATADVYMKWDWLNNWDKSGMGNAFGFSSGRIPAVFLPQSRCHGNRHPSHYWRHQTQNVRTNPYKMAVTSLLAIDNIINADMLGTKFCPLYSPRIPAVFFSRRGVTNIMLPSVGNKTSVRQWRLKTLWNNGNTSYRKRQEWMNYSWLELNTI